MKTAVCCCTPDMTCELCREYAKVLRLFDEMEERNRTKKDLTGIAHCYPSLKEATT